nr:NADH dehydrogenase subunit 4 [Chelopistes texanus]
MVSSLNFSCLLFLLFSIVFKPKNQMFSIFLSLLLVYYFFLGQLVSVEKHFFFDFSTYMMITLTLFVTLMCSYLLVKSSSMTVMYSLMVIVLLFFSSSSMIFFFSMFEFSLIPLYYLILGWGLQPERLKASKYMLMYTLLGSFPLILSLVYLAKKWSSLSLVPTFLLFSSTIWKNSISEFWPSMFLMLAFLVKTPIFLSHSWLPKAHVEATTTGSMILAGVMLKTGLYGLIRLIPILENSLFTNTIFSISILGMTLATLVALSSDDMKTSVAYSSVSHMNFSVATLFSLKMEGQISCLFGLFSHGLCSPALFFLASKMYFLTHSRSQSVSKGQMSYFKALVFLSFLAWAFNMAAPPSLSFLSEALGFVSIGSISSFSCFLSILFMVSMSFFCMHNFGLYSHSQKSTMSKEKVYPDVINSLIIMVYPIFFSFFLVDSIY